MSIERLYIAAKPPVPGLVKTRLGRSIGEVQSARLYEAFVQDIARMVRTSSLHAGWFIPPGTGWLPPALGEYQLPTRWQVGDSWGARQARLFDEELARDEGPLVLIASDSPQLLASDIAAGFGALRSADVVVGPVLDGGYYLVGMRRSHDILAPIQMSTATVCSDVVAHATSLGLRTATLPARFDVDEGVDLDLLRDAGASHLVTTRAWLDVCTVLAE